MEKDNHWPLWTPDEKPAAYAERVKLPSMKKVVLDPNTSMTFCLIPPGTFNIGSTSVVLSQPFYMSIYEVTQAQFISVMQYNPSEWQRVKQQGLINPNLPWGHFPVESLRFKEAQFFCTKLSDREHQIFRLPTEAEWEYACRAGTKTLFYSGNTYVSEAKFDTRSDLNEVGWYSRNAPRSRHVVGEKNPNQFGLFDMHGNVREMCSDEYELSYYSIALGLRLSPRWHVVRGGSFDDEGDSCSSSARDAIRYDHYDRQTGFRVVLEVRR